MSLLGEPRVLLEKCWSSFCKIYGCIAFLLFQSVIDFFASVILFMSTLTLNDRTKVHSRGILAQLECRLWNTKYFLWAFFCASTWNIVAMTIERYESNFKSIVQNNEVIVELSLNYLICLIESIWKWWLVVSKWNFFYATSGEINVCSLKLIDC